jgi:tRNA(Ile)-lysidine synthase
MSHLKRKVLDTVQKYDMIRPGEKIVVGVSGGPDSMALLYLLYDLRDDLECNLHIAHLDHKLRGAESKADAAFVEEHARKLSLPVTVAALDVCRMILPGESLESGARRIRYEFYERVIVSTRASKIALGHNADDQAETVMMRLLRGSGAQGLGGIPPVRDSKFIRPLIEVSRSEIDEYLEQLQIKPRQDSSNLSTVYERNKVRLELIPMLEREYRPNIKQILQQTGDILREEDDLLIDLAREGMDNCVQFPDVRTAIIRISDFRGYHLALQRRILRLAIEKLTGDLSGFDYDHIRNVLNLALFGATGNVVSLPRGLSAEKVYDELILRPGRPETRVEPFDYSVRIPGETKIPELGLSIRTIGPERVHTGEFQSNKDRFREIFDYDKIRGELHLRNRRPGDRFQPLGMSGMKKLKDFFIDEKIPSGLRDRIPILTDAANILWVVGYRMDDRFKITANTEKQLVITAIPDNTPD